MCNDYEQHIRWAQYCAMMQAAEMGIPTQQSELDLPQADDIRINDSGPVMRAAGNVIELVPHELQLSAFGPRRAGFQLQVGRPSLRQKQPLPHSGIGIFRVHGKEISQSKAPVHAQWRTLPRHCRDLAGRKAGAPPAFTMLTTSPGPDVSPTIHDRSWCCDPTIGRPGFI